MTNNESADRPLVGRVEPNVRISAAIPQSYRTFLEDMAATAPKFEGRNISAAIRTLIEAEMDRERGRK